MTLRSCLQRPLVALAVGSVLLLTACRPAATPPAEPPAGARAVPPPAAAAAAPTPLALVYNNRSIGMAPLWLTLDAGIFAKHGFDVTLDFAQGTLATQAMINGQFDVGSVSASAVVASNLQGADLRLVAALFTKSIYALVVSRDVTSPAQLRGKTFGISKLGDSSDTTTRLVLRKLGLDPEHDVSILQVGNSPERYAALVAGGIQAMIADPMDVVRAQREGYNVLADQAALSIDYASSAIAMRAPFLREQPEPAQRFVAALVEGMHYYRTQPDAAVAVASKHLQSDDLDALRTAVDVFARTLMPDKPFLTESAMRPIMEEVAFTSPAALDAPLDRFVDNSLLERLDRAGFIDALYR
jgi:NitT/TauT family transport system substrate-binding protein